uniref:(California timema) hypothetical protein n=1 Tax=Timema californicum TaxID=61474 RepID=A0A7R9JKV8_TIMCA|nr:unnamed protein product [Timema californicum]
MLDEVSSWLDIDFSYCERNIDGVETHGKNRIRKPIPGVSAKAVYELTRDSIHQAIYRMYYQGDDDDEDESNSGNDAEEVLATPLDKS